MKDKPSAIYLANVISRHSRKLHQSHEKEVLLELLRTVGIFIDYYNDLYPDFCEEIDSLSCGYMLTANRDFLESLDDRCFHFEVDYITN